MLMIIKSMCIMLVGEYSMTDYNSMHPSIEVDNLPEEALDEVYKTGCKVVNFSRKTLLSMHACEEDIKTLITFFNPKYYVPISGSFTNMMTILKVIILLKSIRLVVNHSDKK